MRRFMRSRSGHSRGRVPSTSRRKRRGSRFESLERRALLAGDVAVFVWHDVNASGFRDPEENALQGWTVFVDTNENGLLEPGEPSALTDIDGEILFTGLEPGFVTVREVLQSGWSPTVGYQDHERIEVIDEDEVSVDFGNTIAQVGSISGTVWNDANGDSLVGASESGLSGWTVYIDANNDAVLDPTDPTATTDANGDYQFPAVQAGQHKVREVLQPGWETSPGFDDNYSVTVAIGQETIVDFLNLTPEAGTVSGTVWNDLDGDGTRAFDPGSGAFTEPGLADWQVFVDLDSNGAISLGEPTAMSDASGDYTLFAVPHGTNTVSLVGSPDWRFTNPASGSYVVNLLNGQGVDGYDFGVAERREAGIFGTVFFDADHDGARSAAERGLSGVTVYLDLDNDGALDSGEPSTVSAADLFYTPAIDETGTYSFTHLASGAYAVREIVPVEQSATPTDARVQSVSVSGAQQFLGANFANVFRPNEIRGVVFLDANGNHVRDAGEPGQEGVVVYVDLDRDDIPDVGEPTTVTAADGSYEFLNLAPGAYVVREIEPPGQEQTYPQTTGGILWPDGVSNPAQGNVTPTSLQFSLADNETRHETVSLTLPGTGGLTDLVDVFLLFDDTGSFVANSPIVRAAFPQIIASLQSALPGIDLGFGVGRLEEYGSFAAEYATGRPFVLNQPIVAASTPGFSASIQAALDREAPGYGGDTPETVFEALYQMVTGAGFDGNDNGSLLESGVAGLVSTQLNPGGSGDVPPFASFTPDVGGGVLPAAGNLGGAGFRAGALPVILVATDTGFAYQPQGETSITGIDGLTLPLSALTQASRPSTPFGAGAGIQQTITGLNALGALVIGLGTNAQSTLDPRLGLESIAKLTGAVNRSLSTIDNGTADPVAPGDPFYFQIGSGFGSTVADGVLNAIQNAATNVSVNIELRASDPRVHITSIPGVLTNIGAGQTATFDVTFEGDGVPRRFDLQFVREGTNVVLGSIPVVMGTPIPGCGYDFDDLDDGEHEEDDDFGNHLDVSLRGPASVVLATGGAHEPYAVPTGNGEQLRAVPVGAIDRVSLRFGEQVVVAQSDLTVVGDHDGPAAIDGFVYDSDSRTATWRFAAPLGPDTFTLTLADTVVDLNGNHLDGEWDNPVSLLDASSSVFPAGDGTPGGAFAFRFTSLPGDANRDNLVSGADYTIWADHYDGGAGLPDKSFADGDFNGDGFVTGADYTLWGDAYGLDLTAPAAVATADRTRATDQRASEQSADRQSVEAAFAQAWSESDLPPSRGQSRRARRATHAEVVDAVLTSRELRGLRS